ncbi:ABC transporter permease [Actinotignum schaalii]|uniref:ABC transporter permease n=1 Tax=Actinotignum timonense TaxID=1870995 RepID=A0AAW9HG46_9ACTO|nr:MULTISPECIES: ABC transporter permease [Actinotignum]MDK6589537.1 ABC transporter permease [Actinotignum timonense]MDK6628898.1 ABC transporter permease [Actinotignum timonense]MDY5137882.1 ABC transporter permease [Actinotignum timonense]MDY5140774.1 ABC transporter permease [Actinotignum timonense]WQN45596.1 ABC transporter permease [Actinotignum schaalii]
MRKQITRAGKTPIWSQLRGQNNEGILLAVLIVLVVVMSIVSRDFLQISTLFAIIRSSIVPLIFALGVLLVIISGGIDVSFAAIAVFSAYATVTAQLTFAVDFGLIGSFLFAMVLGTLLGLINGYIISKFRLPTLIVTLGTQGIFQGVLMTYVGSRYIADLPAGMASASTVNLVTLPTANGVALLHVMIIPAVVLTLAVSWLLNRTMFGRFIYAIGGDEESARRAGINVKSVQMRVYMIVGVMAAIGGVIYMVMGRSASPKELIGGELDIIAAVVLGGASIFGGYGSVKGTVLGVLLVQLINNSLILVGVPSAWQRAAVGVLLIVGVSIQAISAKRARKQVGVLPEETVK